MSKRRQTFLDYLSDPSLPPRTGYLHRLLLMLKIMGEVDQRQWTTTRVSVLSTSTVASVMFKYPIPPSTISHFPLQTTVVSQRLVDMGGKC